jgi:secreted trypsin-like serine protease
MRMAKAVSAAIAIAAVMGISAVSATAASKHNWMKEYVKLREQAQLERAVGIERAAAIRSRAATRIVGGETAKAAANPFQVALLFKDDPDDFSAQFCGGTLYKPNVVVTAAHCSDFITKADVQVLTGTRRLDGTGTRRNVDRIFIHPNWDPVTFDSDVAVWILKTNANGIENAELARLSTELTSGQTLATGWGNTESTPAFPIALRQVIVPLQPRSDCNDADSYNGAVTDNMICAGLDAGGKDTCQGDSGGPLTTRPGDSGGLGDYDVLTGITSWGFGCAEPELFGVYTRVAKFRNWINNKLP